MREHGQNPMYLHVCHLLLWTVVNMQIWALYLTLDKLYGYKVDILILNTE